MRRTNRTMCRRWSGYRPPKQASRPAPPRRLLPLLIGVLLFPIASACKHGKTGRKHPAVLSSHTGSRMPGRLCSARAEDLPAGLIFCSEILTGQGRSNRWMADAEQTERYSTYPALPYIGALGTGVGDLPLLPARRSEILILGILAAAAMAATLYPLTRFVPANRWGSGGGRRGCCPLSARLPCSFC